MTEEKSKEQQEFDKMQELYLTTLKSNSSLYGANELKTSFGKEGSSIADIFTNGPEVAQMKQRMFSQEQEEADQLGIGYTPEVTTYSVVKRAKKESEEAMKSLTLGNLELIAKGFLPGLEVEGVDKFKDKSFKDYVEKIQEVKGDISKLDKETQSFIKHYKILSEAYQKGTALGLMQNSYLSELNGAAKQLSEKYKPSKDKE